MMTSEPKGSDAPADSDAGSDLKRRLPRNVAFQVLSFGVQIGTGLLLVPYLVRNLGLAAYGLIPVAAILTQYASLISQSVASSVSRFIAVALQSGDKHEATVLFNTALFASLGLVALQVPVLAAVVANADGVVEIPSDLLADATVLLACSAVSFLIGLVGSVITVPLYAANRLDVLRLIDVGRLAGRAGGVLVVFTLLEPRLRYVGYVELAVASAALIAEICAARRLAERLAVRWRYCDWRRMGPMLAMGGWVLVSTVGSLLFTRADIVVVSRFLGADAAGGYAALQQWPNLIRAGGSMMAAVVGPLIIAHHARGERGQIVRTSTMAVRLLSSLLAVPIGVMCVYAEPLLTLWLGSQYGGLWPVLVVMVCHLSVNAGVLPILNVQTALNRVRVPALVTLASGLLNVALAVALVSVFDMGIVAVAVAGGVVLTAKNALFSPLYGAAILGQPWHTFLVSFARGAVLLILLLAVGALTGASSDIDDWRELAVRAGGLGVVGLIMVVVLMPSGDRKAIGDMIGRRRMVR